MRPNYIIFMTDQQNAQTIKRESVAKTPHMDRFLEHAAYYPEAYCASPHCCPSRASFFSGMYPSQHGVWNNVEVDNALSRGFYEGVRLFPEILKENGYRTFFSGKWHVSAYEGPLERGFERVLREYISNYGRMEKKNQPVVNDWKKVYQNGAEIDTENETKEFGRIIRPGFPHYYQFGTAENPFGDTTTVELACELIEDYQEEDPFLLFVGTTGPHDPYCPPQEFLDWYQDTELELPHSFCDKMTDKPALYRRMRDRFALSEEEHIESIRRYLAFVSYEDSLFGKLLESLEQSRFKDNTYLIFLTDHGEYMGAHGLWAKGLPCFKEAYNICAAVSGPGIVPGERKEVMVSITDFMPTILETAGIEIPEKVLGLSLKRNLMGQENEAWRTELFTQTNGNEIYGIQRAVWNRKWKYVYNTFDYDELYDLEADKEEMYNLIHDEKYTSIVKEMCRKMWEFARISEDNCTCPYIAVSLAPYGPGIIL